MSSTNRGAERRGRDAYMTPDWLAEAIMPALRQRVNTSPHAVPLQVLEPACGEGAIVRAVKQGLAPCVVTALDLARGNDFLATRPQADWDLIITNPPYSQAEEFVRHAMKFQRTCFSMVAMLLRLGFLASQKRAAWLRKNTPSVYVTPRRPSFTEDGKNDSADYAWMIWGPGEPKVGILETERT